MKKIISLLLCAVLLLVPLAPCAVAADEAGSVLKTDEGIERFEDGSFLVIGILEETEQTFSPSFLLKLLNLMKKLIALLFPNRPMTTSKSKIAVYYDANGKELWCVSLNAEFSYNGKTVSCTDADISYTIKDSDWKLVSSSCSKSQATATGCFAFRQYKLGVPLKLIEKTLTLTCDVNGKVV